MVFPECAWLPGVLRRQYNLHSHNLSQQALWQLLRPAVNRARAEVAGLPPVSLAGPFDAMRRANVPVVFGFSQHLLPRPADWDSRIHVTGFWVSDRVDTWQPPATLLDFLASGPPPVYVGFGSMDDYDDGETARRAIDAALSAGYRIIARIAPARLTTRLPAEAYVVSSIPHDWIFPRVAAVVHHGGLGTTAAALRSATPSVVVPFFADQPFWGARVARLGLGAMPIPRTALTQSALDRALRSVIANPEIKARTREFATLIGRERGCECAASVITEYVAGAAQKV
jgi:UDP:flavonoid glycosyltransferase YjiC (YdhE family)